MKKEKLTFEDIEVDDETQILSRLAHSTFARVLLWLYLKYQNSEFIYASELSDFMKFTTQRAYQLLRDFCKFGLLIRDTSGVIVSFFPKKNNNVLLLEKYVSYAKKTLGLR